MICVIVTTRLHYKALVLTLYDLIWQIRHNYNRLDDGYCDVTGHSKMSVLGTAGAMVTTHENSVMMWSFNRQKWFCVLLNLLEMKEWWASHYNVVYNINLIWNLNSVSDWSFYFGSYFFPFGWDPCGEYLCARGRGLNLLTVVRTFELAQCYCAIIQTVRHQAFKWTDAKFKLDTSK